MGGVSLSGMLPKDVAGLTWWQIENDYLKPMRELAQAIKDRKAPGETVAEWQLPSREDYVAGVSVGHPEWTLAQIHERYDMLLRQEREAKLLEDE